MGNKLQKKQADKNINLLYAAAVNCNMDLMERLLNNGANPNIKDEYGSVPLHSIMYCEKALIGVKILESRGADLHIRDRYGRNAVMYEPDVKTMGVFVREKSRSEWREFIKS